MPTVRFTPADRLLLALDRVLRLAPPPGRTAATDPCAELPETSELSPAERQHAAALMRVNHAGELAAQGLYLGQSLGARSPLVLAQLQAASAEEADHIDWCRARLQALGSRRSVLDPVWFGGALVIGVVAGTAGDDWSMGFVAETERQVQAHLDDHLGRLPSADRRSRAVLEQMRRDEIRHGEDARRAGGRELPAPLRSLMRLASKLMTRTAYRL
ncbi:2-polyprenyl-3-methyl-6-methoxy-1,4-benzoquinone monooxygenase [Immundisolibacter sp.]|uniref:2-polyprenyl-3-methyl-6-methoxy-1,4-benzoquinone monooxygenase n=1 Tax=Immundisolibacter sp. TaxID=1934948 RepID=UPI003562F55D